MPIRTELIISISPADPSSGHIFGEFGKAVNGVVFSTARRRIIPLRFSNDEIRTIRRRTRMAGLTCHGGRSLAGVRLRVTACVQDDPSRLELRLT